MLDHEGMVEQTEVDHTFSRHWWAHIQEWNAVFNCDSVRNNRLMLIDLLHHHRSGDTQKPIGFWGLSIKIIMSLRSCCWVAMLVLTDGHVLIRVRKDPAFVQASCVIFSPGQTERVFDRR
jgi:hypothetical protein